MRDSRRQREKLAREKLVGCPGSDDLDPARQGVDGDDALGTVLLELTSGLNGEHHKCDRTLAKHRDLPMPRDGGMRLGAKLARPGPQVDKLYR